MSESQAGRNPSVAVVGSVNLDIIATAVQLPVAGETVTDATLSRSPGGKGANQALAAARLGADVGLIACVGDDAYADEALALLRQGGVDLSRCQVCDDQPTGVALIAVSESGENQIVVAPGANRSLKFESGTAIEADAVVCQLEVPVGVLEVVSREYEGFFAINLAPARTVPAGLTDRADLIVVNETEAAFYGEAIRGRKGYVAITLGSRGAELFLDGEQVASQAPPPVRPVDTTGAGDTFTAALCVAIVEGMSPDDALRFACTAGALATTVSGAQPSLPSRKDVEEALANPD